MTNNELVPAEALTETLAGLFRELLQGPPPDGPTWITTGGPETALYGCVADLTAEQASRDLKGNTIAGHVEHMRWALQLVNDWFDGREERPDWSESWSVSAVDSVAWDRLRADLRAAGDELLANLGSRHRWNEPMAMNGALSSYGHAAYHLGAILQMRKQV